MKKQLFALLLALLMTAPAFLSCSESGANEETAAETDAAAPSADGEIAAEETVDDSIDENGYLSTAYAFEGDGKHFEKSGYVAWANYLKSHYVDETLIPE